MKESKDEEKAEKELCRCPCRRVHIGTDGLDVAQRRRSHVPTKKRQKKEEEAGKDAVSKAMPRKALRYRATPEEQEKSAGETHVPTSLPRQYPSVPRQNSAHLKTRRR